MGNTHETAVEAIGGIEGYRLQFARIFGEPVTIDNIARAIATFERAIVTAPSAYDFFDPLRSFEKMLKEQSLDASALKDEEPELFAEYQKRLADAASMPMSESAKRGLEIFFSDRGRCSLCHVGANFADEQYHNLGIGMDAKEPDLGRYAVTGEAKDKGAFKTPTIRNVVATAPYMHDGSLRTLEEVVEWYNKGGHPNPYLSDKVKKLDLSAQEKADLLAFMEALTCELPPVAMGRLPQLAPGFLQARSGPVAVVRCRQGMPSEMACNVPAPLHIILHSAAGLEHGGCEQMYRKVTSHERSAPMIHAEQARRVLGTLDLLISVVGRSSIAGVVLEQAHSEIASLLPRCDGQAEFPVTASRSA